MKIGIITVRDGAYHPTRRLTAAAASRGHQVGLIHPYELWPTISDNTPGLSGNQASANLPDVVLPRQGAEIGQSCLALINQLDRMGIPLVNDLAAIRVTRNQFLTLQALCAAGIPVPDTIFLNAPGGTGGVTRYPVVVKQVAGRQGSGVSRAGSKNELDAIVRADLERKQGLLVQTYLPPDGRQDIRVLVIGGKVAGAMRLIPPPGEFRANFHLGATGHAITLADTTMKLAVDATRAVGLEIAGVDLILDHTGRAYIVEVNYSPGFKGLEKATGLDIAGMMIDHAVTMAATQNL